MLTISLVGPAELILQKNDPNEYHSVRVFLLPKIFNKLTKEFDGRNAVKIPINTIPSEAAIKYLEEVFQRHGWKINLGFDKPNKEEPFLKVSLLTPPPSKDASLA